MNGLRALGIAAVITIGGLGLIAACAPSGSTATPPAAVTAPASTPAAPSVTAPAYVPTEDDIALGKQSIELCKGDIARGAYDGTLEECSQELLEAAFELRDTLAGK